MSEVDNKVKMIIEGLLMAAGRPLSLDNISQVFSEDERPDRQELKAVMEAIADDCDGRGFELTEVASGYRFQVKQDLSEWVAKLWEERPPRYTRALLETLALIAYRQPITRGDIEEIRGVGVSSNIIRTLLDREWIRVVGHRDVPGRPAMFATSKQFLDYFNLKSLQDLPPLSEIKELDKSERELDLGDELANQRVIDLPEEMSDEASVELSGTETAEMLAEEEAIELSRKPLDEILNLGNDDEQDAEGEEYEEDEAAGGSDSEPAASGEAPDAMAGQQRPLAKVIPLTRPGGEPDPGSDSEPEDQQAQFEPGEDAGAPQTSIPEHNDSLAADFADEEQDKSTEGDDNDGSREADKRE